MNILDLDPYLDTKRGKSKTSQRSQVTQLARNSLRTMNNAIHTTRATWTSTVIDLPSLPHPEDNPTPDHSEINDDLATNEHTVSSLSHLQTVCEPTFSSEDATLMPHYRS